MHVLLLYIQTTEKVHYDTCMTLWWPVVAGECEWWRHRPGSPHRSVRGPHPGDVTTWDEENRRQEGGGCPVCGRGYGGGHVCGGSL